MSTDGKGPSPVVLNLAANFASLGFIMAAALVAMPLYLRALGAEAYGLVGFYAVLAATFQVLDVGLSQTLSRECARFRAGALDGPSLRRLLGGFEAIFGAVSLVGAVAIALLASPLASHWLQLHELARREVVLSIALMGVAVPAQWMSGLYRGALNGLEHQIALAGFTIVVAALRYFGVLAAMQVLGANPLVFFGYQACLSIVELAVLAIAVRVFVSESTHDGLAPPAKIEIRRLVTFSAAIGLATLTWIVQTQGDKAILSKLLPLAEFGVFTLAVTGAVAITSISAPIGQALLPRLTRLLAEDDAVGATALYREASQLACLIALPPMMLLLFFAEAIMWIWTGDRAVAAQAAPILRAYAVGAGLLPLSAFPYYLQYAHGRLKLHAICQLILLPVLAIGYGVAASHFGAVGTGAVWTSAVLGCVIIYAPIVHRQFGHDLASRWLLHDVAPIAAATTASAFAIAGWMEIAADRLVAFGQLAAAGVGVLIAGGLASPAVRKRVGHIRRRLRLSGIT